MSFSIDITRAVAVAGETISRKVTCTGSNQVRLDESCPVYNGFKIDVALKVSAVKGLFLTSDRNITIKTNSNGSPDDTIELVAGMPYTWVPSDYSNLLFETDVTAFFIQNASGGTATLLMEAVVDATTTPTTTTTTTTAAP